MAAVHVPFLVEKVTKQSAQLAKGLVSKGVFRADEIQFFSKNFTYPLDQAYSEYALGKSRLMEQAFIDTQLQRYSHFSSHKIISIDFEGKSLMAQDADKPLQKFTYEKLFLEPLLEKRPLGYLKLFQAGFIVDPYQDPTHSHINLRNSTKIALIVTKPEPKFESLPLNQIITHAEINWSSINSITRSQVVFNTDRGLVTKDIDADCVICPLSSTSRSIDDPDVFLVWDLQSPQECIRRIIQSFD